jgi:fucose permease
MNLVGISSGAIITSVLGKSADSGNLSRDFLMMITPVLIAIILQLVVLKPKTINMTDDFG